MGQAGEHRGDLLLLQKINEPHQGRIDLGFIVTDREIADRINRDDRRAERTHSFVHHHQMLLQPVQRRARGMDLQQSLFDPDRQIDVDRPHVADDLRRRFFIGEVKCPLPALAGGFDNPRGDAALAGPWPAGNEHAAGAKNALSVKHVVQPGYPGWNPLR